MSDTTGTDPRWLDRRRGNRDATMPLALVILWSLAEPSRVGQVAFVSPRQPEWILGRGSPEKNEREARVTFAVHRPGSPRATLPLGGRGLSRRQVRFAVDKDRLEFERIGRANLLLNDAKLEQGTLRPGDVLIIEGELVLGCATRRRGELSERATTPSFPFGMPDRFGLVGESPRMWVLRDEIAFASRRREHVLMIGPSGSGKELVARAVHGQSRRREGPFASRNAATLPAGIIDAELFGNVKNYPNAGMPERGGLVGAAEHGTLFLDELSELPPELQTHLLRLLDSGEYQRLGEARVRHADLRVLAATNRSIESVKHDVAARFPLRIVVPGLCDCRDDIPLVVRHLLRSSAGVDRELSSRFFEEGPVAAEPRVAPELIAALVRHDFRHNVRELESLLLCSMSKSRSSWLELTPEIEARLQLSETTPESKLAPDALREALRRNGGSVSRASRELGLKNRDVLYRLLKKHGIKTEDCRPPEH